MNVLALDPANRTGFFHTDGYRGFIDLARTLDTHPGQRLIRLEQWLTATLEHHKTNLIAAEDASFGSPNPSVQAGHNELRGVIHLVAAEFGIDVKLFHPCTIKAFATGSGRAKKPDMIHAAKLHFGIEIISEDEADAFWIMKLAARGDCWPKPAAPKKRRVKTLPPQRRLFR